MNEREFNQMMLPECPARGEIIWSRVVARVVGLIILVLFWGGVAYGVANAQDLTVYNYAHVSAKKLRRIERDVVLASASLDRYWGTGHAHFVAQGGWPIYLRSSAQSMAPAGSGALGYHTYSWRPYAVIWTGSPSVGYPWQGTFDHEVKEMLVDPTTQRLMGGSTPDTGYVVEVCDPVVDWSYGGYMADFVTPAWFTKGTAGTWDAMHKLTASLTTSPTGYWTKWAYVRATAASGYHASLPPVTIQRFAP